MREGKSGELVTLFAAGIEESRTLRLFFMKGFQCLICVLCFPVT